MLLEPGVPTRILVAQPVHAEVYECEPEPPALLHNRFLNFLDAQAEGRDKVVQDARH